ncbi:MAG: hypothetical protein NVS9B7_10420 [Flavisolibacter sp.]
MFDFAVSTMRQFHFILSTSITIFFISCGTVKYYPIKRPFIYQTNISINGRLSTREKVILTDQLTQQLDDSIKVRKQQKLLFFKALKFPPLYDSMNVSKSISYMHLLLNSLGYYRDTISFTKNIRIVDEDQYRTTLNFNVSPGILIKLDAINYNLIRDTLQQITLRSSNKALIKKGDPFAKPLISAEFDRLSDLFRDNGYLRFTKDELVALWDTVGLNLIRPTFDPVEQAQLLQALQKRKLNPTADLEVRLRNNADSLRLTRYYVGHVSVHTTYNGEAVSTAPLVDTIGEYKFIASKYQFKPKKFTDFIYLHHGDLYRQSNYIKTQYKFNSLSAWRLVTIDQLPRMGEDTVDLDLKLTPARKFAFTANIEGSQNQGNILFGQEGTLFGLGLTLRLTNRNFAKASNQAQTNLRFGTELNASTGSSFVQTTQYSINHTIEFPRGIPKNIIPRKSRENTRSFLSLNAGNTDRRDYYIITSFNGSFGYEFNWRNKLLKIRVPNVEYNLLTRRDSLLSLIKNNASYKYIFNDGLILSTIINYKIAGVKKNRVNLANFSLETSGLIAGLFRSPILDKYIYRFVKIDAEFSETFKIRRSAFAWRIFGGIGYEIPSSHDTNDVYLPFFREYYAGGPNSMRAWPLRKLGPGSTIRSFANNIAPDRFGDMRLEANGEYRFYLSRLFGFNLEGALFTDIGNVWFLKPNKDFPNGEFQFNKLWTDIAIGAGTGLRVDFGFLKARFDYAYKVKNPTPEFLSEKNKWFYGWQIFNGQFQLGIDYPF